MNELLIVLITFLSTFFAVLHFVSSFRYKAQPNYHANENLGFSIIIPCFNEERILPQTISGILELAYDNFEVIFVNDGSSDHTYDTLCDKLDLLDLDGVPFIYGVKSIRQSRKYRFVYVIDKDNSGKADSLNIGIKLSHKELIITMDADCILEKNSLCLMNQTFQDKDIIASGGAVHVMQYLLLKKRKFIICMQALDFIKGFYIYKASLAYNNALSIISGAFGVFRKDVLQKIGGFRRGLGEDIDITIRLQEYAIKNNKILTYNARALCYTECPEGNRDLSKQRTRWQKAFIDALVNNQSFLLRNFFKSNVCFFMIADALITGTTSIWCFIFNIVLVVSRSVTGISLYYIIFLLLAVLFNIINSLVAVYRAKKVQPNLKTPLLCAMILPEIICFSILRIYYYLRGTVSYFSNNRKWDKVERTNNNYQVTNLTMEEKEK
jgi:cellulose synthase/poly-beta-1,6-N-acetylglucosamine synthase-like glycosyltransferase